MIFVTGDTHGDIRRLSSKGFPYGRQLTKNDFVVVCGDFGLVWDCHEESKEERYWLDWLNDRPFTTLFIDGNHENYKRLDAFSEERWNGGKIHRIRDSVIHMMRGQIFELPCASGTKTVFTFGGAKSHDIRDGILDPTEDKKRIREWRKQNQSDFVPHRQFRILGESWWPQEMPSTDEMQEGVDNLNRVGWKVDYIFTHDCCGEVKRAIGFKRTGQVDGLNSYLNLIYRKCQYERWYFGHYHRNLQINARNFLLYEAIVNAEACDVTVQGSGMCQTAYSVRT